jgi:predicted 3-demethylubiquinone-9 3-methyltransferase (glyoxalase superfamily)
MKTEKIVTFLTYRDQAEEAARMYCALFPDSEIVAVTKYPDAMPDMAGKVMSATFRLNGQTFYALNGGPHFTFSEGISLFVHCEDQKEVDHYWNGLLEGGGQESACGWLKDKYGVSWQIIPRILSEILASGDAKKSAKLFEAMLKMKKIKVDELEAATHG